MTFPDSTSTATTSPQPDAGEDKKPRPVACTQCHSSKVKCDKSFPCSRCVRLNMADQCTPHVSQQGRGKKRRRNAANATATADSGASGGAGGGGGKGREKGGSGGGSGSSKTGGGGSSKRKSKQAKKASSSSAAGARGGGTSAAPAAASVHNSMSAPSSSIMGGGSTGMVTGAGLAIGGGGGGGGGMNNTGSNPTQGGASVSLGGGIADAITGSLGLHHGHNVNVNLGLPAVHAHAALGHNNNTGNLGPSAIKAAPNSSASDSQTNNTSAGNANSNSNVNVNNAIVTGPKTGIEENLSVSATSLGPNHFGLRHLLRTWVAFAIKRRSFSLLAKASTLAAKTGVTMDNILCGEDDSVAAAAAQASAATLSPSALIAAADASGGLNCHSHHAALSVLSGASAATATGKRDAHSSDSAAAAAAAGKASANTRTMPDHATNTTGGGHNATSSPSAASATAAAISLTEPMSFLLPALLTPASSQEMENTPLSWAELPAELLTATGCHVPLTQGASNDIAPVLGSRWIFVRWLHQGRSRYFVSPAFERDIVSWATIQSTWNANNREVTGLFVPRSEMPTHTRGIMHQFAIHPRVGMPLRANRYKTKIKVRAAVAPMGSAPSAEEPGMVEMVVDGVMCQKMMSLDTAFLFIEYVRDEVTPATVLASLSSHGGATAAATAINAHSQQQPQMQPQLHGAMAGIGSGSMVPNQAQLQGNQLLAQMAANMIGAGNAGANDYHRATSNMSGNSVSSDAIANAVLQQQQQQQQQAVGGVDGNSGSITPQALVSGAGGTGSGLDGLDFFDLDGSHASLAEMDELLNLIRQCP